MAARQPARARARLAAASPAAASRMTKSSSATRASVTRSPASPTTTRSPRTTASTTIPAYEHGYNIGKHHQLAIGARKVDWVDFPIWQSRSHLQFIINRVAATADLVAIVHPESRNAYDDDDLQRAHRLPPDRGLQRQVSARRGLGRGALERPRRVGDRQRRQPRSREPRAARRRLDDDQRAVRRARRTSSPRSRQDARTRWSAPTRRPPTRCSTARRSPIGP